MSNAKKASSALLLITAGTPPIQTKSMGLRNACHCTRRTRAQGLAGNTLIKNWTKLYKKMEKPTAFLLLSQTTNTMGDIASQV